MTPLLLGTRGSQLALSQAEGVRAQVAGLFPDREVELEALKTLGDQLGLGTASLNADAPQGIFTKELDEALLKGSVRGAIHSLKDVPTQLPAGIRYGAFLEREDPRDAWVSRNGLKFYELPAGSRVGTSSPRRAAQVRALRSELKVVPLRGNVDTRLRKLHEGEVDAVLLASAGLRRLERQDEATELLSPEVMLPAPAQGIVCVTILESDREMAEKLKALDDAESRICAEAERSFLKELQGGRRVPVGALARLDQGTLYLSGLVAYENGEQVLRYSETGKPGDPSGLGKKLASIFLKSGAKEILEAFGRSTW